MGVSKTTVRNWRERECVCVCECMSVCLHHEYLTIILDKRMRFFSSCWIVGMLFETCQHGHGGTLKVCRALFMGTDVWIHGNMAGVSISATQNVELPITLRPSHPTNQPTQTQSLSLSLSLSLCTPFIANRNFTRKNRSPRHIYTVQMSLPSFCPSRALKRMKGGETQRRAPRCTVPHRSCF